MSRTEAEQPSNNTDTAADIASDDSLSSNSENMPSIDTAQRETEHNDGTNKSDGPKTTNTSNSNTCNKPGSSSSSSQTSGQPSSNTNSNSNPANNTSSSINPKDIEGKWRLDGATYAYLNFNGKSWSSNFMTLRDNRFITYENDGWLPNSGNSEGYSSSIGEVFNKNDANSSMSFLQSNYGMVYKNSKLYFAFGGKTYSFTKTRQQITPVVYTTFKELTVNSPNTKYASSKLCVSPGSGRYLTMDKNSQPYPIEIYDTLSFGPNSLMIEYAGKNSDGDYRFRVTSFEGDDPNYLVYFLGLRLSIERASSTCHE